MTAGTEREVPPDERHDRVGEGFTNEWLMGIGLKVEVGS